MKQGQSQHCSSFGRILDCERQTLDAYYNPGESSPVSAAALVGTLAHDQIENLSRGRSSKNLSWMSEEIASQLVRYDRTTPSAIPAIAQAARIADLGHEFLSSLGGEIAYELPVESKIRSVNVVGRVDCLSDGRVIDVKTGTTNEISYAVALGAYSILTEATENPWIIPIRRRKDPDKIFVGEPVEFGLQACKLLAYRAIEFWEFYLKHDREIKNVRANPFSRFCGDSCRIYATEDCPLIVKKGNDDD